MGYRGIGYKTADVRAVPLAEEEGEDYIDPTPENAEFFPLSRFLLLAVNYRPGSELDPLRREFIKYIYSQQGQTDVIKDGYLPLPAAVAKAQLAKVGISN
jgi:phosphate transport system substrate-binding protein